MIIDLRVPFDLHGPVSYTARALLYLNSAAGNFLIALVPHVEIKTSDSNDNGPWPCILYYAATRSAPYVHPPFSCVVCWCL
jgi:hypothetical protein